MHRVQLVLSLLLILKCIDFVELLSILALRKRPKCFNQIDNNSKSYSISDNDLFNGTGLVDLNLYYTEGKKFSNYL